MNRNFDSQHKSQPGSGASRNKFSTQSSTPRKEVDSDEKRSEGGSSGVLREIPWAGPYLDFIYRKWGWRGLFLRLGGSCGLIVHGTVSHLGRARRLQRLPKQCEQEL